MAFGWTCACGLLPPSEASNQFFHGNLWLTRRKSLLKSLKKFVDNGVVVGREGAIQNVPMTFRLSGPIKVAR